MEAPARNSTSQWRRKDKSATVRSALPLVGRTLVWRDTKHRMSKPQSFLEKGVSAVGRPNLVPSMLAETWWCAYFEASRFSAGLYSRVLQSSWPSLSTVYVMFDSSACRFHVRGRNVETKRSEYLANVLSALPHSTETSTRISISSGFLHRISFFRSLFHVPDLM